MFAFNEPKKLQKILPRLAPLASEQRKKLELREQVESEFVDDWWDPEEVERARDNRP